MTPASSFAVETLAADVGAVTAARSWADKSAATGRLVDALLGGSTAHRHWPEAERDDLDRLVDALSRLSGLDDIEPRPSTDVFRRALDAELDSARARRHPYGTGMLYGPLATAVGQDLDAVFVVGMVEGLECKIACTVAGIAADDHAETRGPQGAGDFGSPALQPGGKLEGDHLCSPCPQLSDKFRGIV